MYKTIHEMDDVLAQSEKGIFIFKFSTTCGVSAAAKDRLDAYFTAHPEHEVYLLTVQEQRDISNALSERLGVRHESPQLLYIKNGKVVFDIDHHHVTAEEIDANLEKPAD